MVIKLTGMPADAMCPGLVLNANLYYTGTLSGTCLVWYQYTYMGSGGHSHLTKLHPKVVR